MFDVLSKFLRSLPSTAQAGQSALRARPAEPFELVEIGGGDQCGNGFTMPCNKDGFSLFHLTYALGQMRLGFCD